MQAEVITLSQPWLQANQPFTPNPKAIPKPCANLGREVLKKAAKTLQSPHPEATKVKPRTSNYAVQASYKLFDLREWPLHIEEK